MHPGEDDHRAVLPLGSAAVAVAVAAGHARELTRGALDHPSHLPRERGEPAGALGVGAGGGVEISVSVFGRGAQVGTLVVGVGVVELDGLVVRAHHRGDDVGGTRVELVPSQRRQLIVRPGRRLGERRHPRVEPLRGQRGVVESEGPSRGRGALPREVRQDPAQHQPDLRPLLGGARAEVHQERHAPHAVRHRRASNTGSNHDLKSAPFFSDSDVPSLTPSPALTSLRGALSTHARCRSWLRVWRSRRAAGRYWRRRSWNYA